MTCVLTACEERVPQYLESLRQDPMASLELPGAVLLDNTEIEATRRFGKPVSARVIRTFRIGHANEREQILTIAVDRAEAAAWTMDRIADDVASGAKELATGSARVSIVLRSEPDGWHVRITLTHDWGSL